MGKRPTLKEVKEYFKDAKTVECLFNGFIFDISKSDLEKDVCKFGNEYFLDTPDDCPDNLLIFDDKHRYAKILTYKNRQMKISKENIIKLDKKETTVRELFPDVFEEQERFFNEPLLSLNDLLFVWAPDDNIELYKNSPLFKNFERMAERNLNNK
jgi:hypothetical protein